MYSDGEVHLENCNPIKIFFSNDNIVDKLAVMLSKLKLCCLLGNVNCPFNKVLSLESKNSVLSNLFSIGNDHFYIISNNLVKNK